MPEFHGHPGVEVVGLAIKGFINAFPNWAKETGLRILERHGLKDANPNGWYPFQAWLDAMKEIQDTLGAGFLTRVGEQTVLGTEFPPEWKTLEVILPVADVGYQMQHRGGDPGHYTFGGIESSRGLKRAKIICDNPHGCAFNRGTLEGLVKRFRPEGAIDVLVRHDEAAPCKKKGGNSCTFIITWA